MKVCESMVEEIARLMRDRFFSELSEQLGSEENVLRSLNNIHYNNVVAIFIHRSISDLRRMMRDNHLAIKTDAVLRSYVNKHFDEFIEVKRKVFDVYYSSNDCHVVQRSRLHVMHKELFSNMKEIYSSAIWECRLIAAEGEKRINEIDKEIDVIRINPCPGGGK